MSPGARRCVSCGRPLEYRRRWAQAWDDVRRCSARCRRARPGAVDRALEAAILDLLLGRSGTACPSEAARRVDPDGWRRLGERTRRAARRLAAADRIEVMQRGRVVDAATMRGPVRLRLRRR